mmetsp:Transcript_29765/g.41873  ORF Transcript_29765/g.41873 Transcript_29765/m.41873 type:complete len:1134 (-) Transcript_29765:66-3467(-)
MKKLVQAKFYSLLSTKWGMLTIVIGCFFLFNSITQLLILIAQTPQEPTIVVREIVTQQQNITIVTNPNTLCIPEIDLVYTWVNGSDPRHIATLRETKRILKGEIFRLCNSTEKPEEHNCTRDEETASRFEDNEELRYSLRSVEQFAPWVRHIYLVTNGQVPYWLNLTHPKLSVVTHDQIFVNKSHLPTFSSPAIETHLHRIPGLADKFLYFNDDTMLGNQVWPDDFYTVSGGQKVFLAWPVPNCNEGCPPSWVRDGVCDLPCNVSDCDWDGGDCLNATATQSGSWWSGRSGNTGRQNANTNYCAVGCPDSWIGDKYCDRNCKVLECGFDAGDCDVEDIFSKMHGENIYADVRMVMRGTDLCLTQYIEIPAGVPAVYFNLTIAHEKKITDGSHDNAVLVRTATISQKHKIMTLTFHRNVTRQLVGISISVENNGETIEYAFNVSAETYSLESNLNATTTDGASNTTAPLNTTEATPASSSDNNNATESLQPMEPPIAIPSEPATVSDTGGTPQDSVTVDSLENLPPVQVAAEAEPAPSESEVAGTARKVLSILIEGEPEPQQEQTVTSRKLFGVSSFGTLPRPIQIRESLESSDSRLLENVLDEEQLRNLALEFVDSFDADFFLSSEGQDNHEDGEHTPAEMDKWQKWVEDNIRQKYAAVVKQHEAQANKNVKKPHDNTDSHEMDQPFPWDFPSKFSPEVGRRLLDMYGDSLKWVNRLLNEEFGSSSRKVPAHMPHFIDKKIVEQMQAKWAQQFDATSSHQLRDSHDMQFAFSYFYFMIHQREEFNLTNVWNQFLDMDHDGKLNDNELRTLAVHLRGTPLPVGFVPKLKLTLLNCTGQPIPQEYVDEALKYSPIPTRAVNNTKGDNQTETESSAAPAVPSTPQSSPQNSENPDSTINSLSPSSQVETSENPTPEPNRIPGLGRRQPKSLTSMMPEHAPITIDTLLHENCAAVYADIQKHFGKRLKNKHQITDTEEVAFLMVNNNASTTLKSLDGIRERRQKFICLNDNMNHTDPSVKEVLGVIKDFYDSLYPLPSSFELPPGVENPFLHLDEYEVAEPSKDNPPVAPPKRRELSTRTGTVTPKKEPQPDMLLYGLAGFTFLAVACFLMYVCSGFFAASRDRRTKERRFLKVVNA